MRIRIQWPVKHRRPSLQRSWSEGKYRQQRAPSPVPSYNRGKELSPCSLRLIDSVRGCLSLRWDSVGIKSLNSLSIFSSIYTTFTGRYTRGSLSTVHTRYSLFAINLRNSEGIDNEFFLPFQLTALFFKGFPFNSVFSPLKESLTNLSIQIY